MSLCLRLREASLTCVCLYVCPCVCAAIVCVCLCCSSTLLQQLIVTLVMTHRSFALYTATVASVFFWGWRKAKQDGHQYLLGDMLPKVEELLPRTDKVKCSPRGLLSCCRWGQLQWSSSRGYPSVVAPSAILDLADWRVTLGRWGCYCSCMASACECLPCLFQVTFGGCDNKVSKKGVRFQNNSSLVVALLHVCFGVCEESLCFPFSLLQWFRTAIFLHLLFSKSLAKKWSASEL